MDGSRNQRLQHPRGLDTTITTLSTEDLHNRTTLFQTFAHNVQIWMWSSVTPNSRGQYQTGWNHYLHFIDLFGTNIMMDRIPDEFTFMCTDQHWSFSLPETVFEI